MPPVIAVKTDSPCKEDVAAFCESVQPGGGRLYRCLWEHEGELSVSCRARMNEIRTTGGAECKEDIAKFCASVPQAKGLLAKCLEQHRNELSDACKALATKAGVPSPPAAPGGAAAAAPAAAAPAAKPPATGPDAGKK